MHKMNLALCCLLFTGAAIAQQTPSSSSPAKPATPSASASSAASPSSTPSPSAGSPGAAKAPANPLTDAQARQMLEMTGALTIKEQLLHSMMAYFRANMPFLPPDVSTDLEQSFQKLDLETPIIAIYKQHISTEDADAVIAFYKTPAGKDMIHAMPELMQQSQQLGIQLGRKTAQEVVERHRPEIEAAAKQYQQDHTPKPAPSLNTPSGATPTKPSSTPPSN